MSSYFLKIAEDNKNNLNKPADTDMVYYSELNEWFTTNAFRSFSVKYVVDNCIHYKVGCKIHDVKAGELLFACKQPSVEAYFDTPKLVKSICIDIKPETVNEAFTVMQAREHFEFDNYLSGYFNYPEFFEAVCSVTSAIAVHDKLNSLVHAIAENNAQEHIKNEWFLDLVERIVYHEYGNYLALNGLHSVKTSTRKETLERLNTARNYMDENYLHIEDINEVANTCHLSTFHFFRSFRQAFRITPYQYLLNRRLEHGKQLLTVR
jgi:AraC family transcriptional regulator